MIYKKVATDAGHPLYAPREMPKGSGKIVQPPDLTKIAQAVGKPGRQNCGACHFNGGGGDADGALGSDRSFVAHVPLPEKEQIEALVLEKKKKDLLAKYASEELQERQGEAKAMLNKS